MKMHLESGLSSLATADGIGRLDFELQQSPRSLVPPVPFPVPGSFSHNYQEFVDVHNLGFHGDSRT